MATGVYASARGAWATSFRYRDFRYLWVSTVLDSIGFGMESVALGWLVFEMTDSPFWVTVAFSARIAPFLLLGVVSGALSDWMERRLLLRFITIARGTGAGLMAFLVLADLTHLANVMLLTLVGACVSPFLQTARQAFAYDLVGPRDALNGLSLNAMGQRVGAILGALLAGVGIDFLGLGNQYLLVGAVYLVALVVLFGVRSGGQAAPEAREPVLRNLSDSILMIRQNRTLAVLIALTGLTESLGWVFWSLLPVMAREVLGVGAAGLGALSAAAQCGGIVGLMVLANLRGFRKKGQLMFVAAVVLGLGEMAFSIPWAASFLIFIVLLALVNAWAFVSNTIYQILMQDSVPNEQRGRAAGAWVLAIGISPAGHLAAGGIAGALGAPTALLVYGAALVLVTAGTALALPGIRRLE